MTKKNSIKIILLMVGILILGVGCKKEVVELEPLGKYDNIEDITAEQKHMASVLMTMLGEENTPIVNKNQKEYEDMLKETGISGDSLHDFVIYYDEDKAYIVIDTILGDEPKVFEEVGNYLIERTHRDEEYKGEEYHNSRLYISSLGDYMIVVVDEYPSDMAVEMMNGLVDPGYEVKSREDIIKDIEAENKRIQEKIEREEQDEQEQKEREELEKAKEKEEEGE